MNARHLSTPMLIVAGLLISQSLFAAEPVRSERSWTERHVVTTPEPTLEIRNVWGDVHVLPGPEGEITLAISERRSAPTQALYDRSLEVYGLEIDASEQWVDLRVGDYGQSWHGRNPCRRCRVDFEIEVHVPPGTKVYASTVNDGDVEVSDIRGQVSADNVNGPVTIRNASACETVASVNGDVSLSFARAPATDCSIETINGDIRIQVPDDSGLDVAMNLGNGRMSTELPVDPLALPARVEHFESGGSHQYRIQQAAGVRLAGGGPVFNVSSMNGDLRIQRTQ